MIAGSAGTPRTPGAPWASPAEEVARALGCDLSAGLTAAKSARRLAVQGPNVIAGHRPPGRWYLLARQFADVLVAVLVAAAALSGLVLGEWIEAGVIGGIVLLNAALGYVQHAKAEDALAALRRLTAPDATVLRDGSRRRIPAAHLVDGDLVVLEAGDRVPADARLVEAVHLRVDEAVLTGESVPRDKSTEAVAPDALPADRTCVVFSGTTVVAGRGSAVVVATGGDTEFGRIAALVEAQPRETTPLQRRLAALGRRLAAAAGLVAIAVFATGLARDVPGDEMFLTAVALAVAAIPEGLPAAVTITLARGTQRLATEHALVRRLTAVETLGAASVICTDKTGTLTRNELRVSEVVGATGPAPPHEFARVAALCNDARRADDGWAGDPTDVALLRAAEAELDPDRVRSEHARIDERAFDASRQRMTTLHRCGDHYLLAIKGAPEVVLARSARAVSAGGETALDYVTRDRLLGETQRLAAAGLRTLALAQRRLDAPPARLEDAEDELCFVALVGMLDDLRDEATQAVREARLAGVRVVVVTGDHAATTATLARRLGLVAGPDDVMDGRRLHSLDDVALASEVEHWGAYARVDPTDKVKIVRAWQARGAVVAMTGDGVNDAPALRAADIGVAMGSGTDVGREAGDMVLADDNFASIVAAIREGRRIFLNLQKLLHFLLAANIAEVIVVAVGLMAFSDLGPPLLATQILWINLVTDGLPVLALAADPAPFDVMAHPPHGRRPLLDGRDQRRLALRGTLIAAATLVALVWAHVLRDTGPAHVRTTVFTTLVALQMAWVLAVRRSAGDGGGVRPARNRFLGWTIAASLALQVLVVHAPIGHDLFDTVPLDAADWALTAGLTVVVYAVLSRPADGFLSRNNYAQRRLP